MRQNLGARHHAYSPGAAGRVARSSSGWVVELKSAIAAAGPKESRAVMRCLSFRALGFPLGVVVVPFRFPDSLELGDEVGSFVEVVGIAQCRFEDADVGQA